MVSFCVEESPICLEFLIYGHEHFLRFVPKYRKNEFCDKTLSLIF
jgi:hypothetical protein